MPSRTVVYGAGAATGILVGALVAKLNGAAGRQRLERFLRRGGPSSGTPTHITLPDWVSELPEPDGDAVHDGRGALTSV
jgi:hypothetical protein